MNNMRRFINFRKSIEEIYSEHAILPTFDSNSDHIYTFEVHKQEKLVNRKLLNVISDYLDLPKHSIFQAKSISLIRSFVYMNSSESLNKLIIKHSAKIIKIQIDYLFYVHIYPYKNMISLFNKYISSNDEFDDTLAAFLNDTKYKLNPRILTSNGFNIISKLSDAEYFNESVTNKHLKYVDQLVVRSFFNESNDKSSYVFTDEFKLGKLYDLIFEKKYSSKVIQLISLFLFYKQIIF